MENGYMPWLSLATAAFESGAMGWVLRGPGRREIVGLTAMLLAILAGYQLTEVWVCSHPEQLLRSKVAMCVIVWLPSVGLSLMGQCGGGVAGWARVLLRLCYVCCGALCVWVLLDQTLLTGTACSAVLATFHLDAEPLQYIYGGFYQAGLVALMLGGAVVMRGCDDPVRRAHVADLQMGVIAFVVPAFLTQFAWKSLDPSLPSLMCHYALLLAIFLLRLSLRERRHALASNAQRGG